MPLRENWARGVPLVNLSADEITSLCEPAFPGQRVLECDVARGGLVNTNLRVCLSHRDEPILLRLYVRDPDQARKEWALNRLTAAADVPVPRFFHFAESNPVTGHPYVLMEWVEGVRLEVLVGSTEPDLLAELGHGVGAALACIHAITFPTYGFFDDHLNVATSVSNGSDGLVAFLRHCQVEGRGSERLDAETVRTLLAFAETEGPLLNTWIGAPCLVHADFGGSNILVRQAAGKWNVAAVLDWEFAFSGTPFFDLGNLLRPPLGVAPGFERAVIAGYRAAGGYLPPHWKRMSLLTDLTAWAEFLNRPTAGDTLIADATRMVTETVRNWPTARSK
jgi:aminoglycoside phosphotransferase (APT) family kinase protein